MASITTDADYARQVAEDAARSGRIAWADVPDVEWFLLYDPSYTSLDPVEWGRMYSLFLLATGNTAAGESWTDGPGRGSTSRPAGPDGSMLWYAAAGAVALALLL